MPDARKIIGTFWRSLKLLALAILILLIIAAIYFQAPWKATALLLIILLANVLLPKGKKRWFWAAAGIVAIALIVWVFLPDNNTGWRPYTFDKELTALETKYKIPDEQNAALIYQPLLESLKEKQLEPNLTDPNAYWRIAPHQPWRSKDYPELAKWIENHKQTIDTLLEASRKEKCHFPIIADVSQMQSLMDRVAPMRHLIYLLEASANNDIAENRTESGIEKYTAAMQIAKHELQQTTMIELMVGMALDAFATSNINRLIVEENVSESQLDRIEQALNTVEFDWSKDWPRVIENEKLLFKNMMAEIHYEVNEKGQIRYSRSLPKLIDSEEIYKQSYLLGKYIKSGVIVRWFWFPSNPEDLSLIIDDAYKSFSSQEPQEPFQKSFWKYRFNIKWLSREMASTEFKTASATKVIYVRSQTSRKGIQLLIPLKRYKNKNGVWPNSLDEIKDLVPAEAFIDPLNGGAFVYKLTKDNFTLYSRGKNGIDEGGKQETEGSIDSEGNWIPKSKEDDLLIWPSRNCDTKKENKDVKQQ